MNINTIMKGPRLKVRRADSHIAAIAREAFPLSKDLYEITNGPNRSAAPLARPDGFYLTYRPKEPITDHFCPIIGDAVNNLRESLDLWMNAAAKVVGPPKKLHFPFSKEWKDLKASPNYPKVYKAFPDAADFIFNDIKPCRDTNLYLWAATSLCNDNKHNDFLPIITVTNIENINAKFGQNSLQSVSMGGDANREIKMIRSRTLISVQNNFNTTVEISFPKGAIFENEPVIPTLKKMSEVVTETLDALERFLELRAK